LVDHADRYTVHTSLYNSALGRPYRQIYTIQSTLFQTAQSSVEHIYRQVYNLHFSRSAVLGSIQTGTQPTLFTQLSPWWTIQTGIQSTFLYTTQSLVDHTDRYTVYTSLYNSVLGRPYRQEYISQSTFLLTAQSFADYTDR